MVAITILIIKAITVKIIKIIKTIISKSLYQNSAVNLLIVVIVRWINTQCEEFAHFLVVKIFLLYYTAVTSSIGFWW